MKPKNRISNRISEAKLRKYFEITKQGISKASQAKKDVKRKREALDVLDMAQRYYDDAIYFFNKGDYVNAFAALNYAHGWLDAGARLRLFYVFDNLLFTVDDSEELNSKETASESPSPS